MSVLAFVVTLSWPSVCASVCTVHPSLLQMKGEEQNQYFTFVTTDQRVHCLHRYKGMATISINELVNCCKKTYLESSKAFFKISIQGPDF